MSQEIRFYIEGSQAHRPDSRRTLYVDGAADGKYRDGVDQEFSHWLPNRTADRFKAGISTEICFRFLDTLDRKPYDLVINNHLDMDGLLSVFVLTHPTTALQHRQVLCEAARAGDFWAWVKGKALVLFQELALLFEDVRRAKLDKQEAYQTCFARVLGILQGQETTSLAQDILAAQRALIEQGTIIREELGKRLVCYTVPKETVGNHAEAFLSVAAFNEPISERLAFWPQVRNHLDAEKIHLVAVEISGGVHYDLWFPGYCWADTCGLWRPPGLVSPLRTEDLHILEWDALTKAAAVLRTHEQGTCQWEPFPGLHLGNAVNPRDFPIVLSTGRQRSSLSPALIKDVLKGIF